jgi:hypothetical protein
MTNATYAITVLTAIAIRLVRILLPSSRTEENLLSAPHPAAALFSLVDFLTPAVKQDLPASAKPDLRFWNLEDFLPVSSEATAACARETLHERNATIDCWKWFARKDVADPEGVDALSERHVWVLDVLLYDVAAPALIPEQLERALCGVRFWQDGSPLSGELSPANSS